MTPYYLRLSRKQQLTKEARDTLIARGWKKGKPPPLDKMLRSKLLAAYEADVSKLAAITGMEFGEWFA